MSNLFESEFNKWFASSDWPNQYRDACWAGWLARHNLKQAQPKDQHEEKVLAKRQLDAMLVQMLTSDGPAQLDYILANAGDLVNLVNHIKRLGWEHE